MVAAKLLGHDFIGIEISKEYIEYAKKRLENYKNELQYAQEEIAKHIVEKTFKERKKRGEFTGRFGKRASKKVLEDEMNLFKYIKSRKD